MSLVLLSRDQGKLGIRFLLGALAFLLVIAACRASKTTTSSSDTSSFAEIVTSSMPPFSTREPKRYKATRVISTIESDATNSAVETQISQVSIARDGEKRREEYGSEIKNTIVYLEIPAGQFMLLPSRKVYAELAPEYVAVRSNEAQSDVDADFSADRLVNEFRTAAHYQRLGSEVLNGLKTAKYRVTVGDVTGGTGNVTETLVWIDEELGMPIRSETSSTGADRSAKMTVVLKDIETDVGDQLFELPKDYKKVGASVIRAQIASALAGKSVMPAGQK
jgi:hypothetical protein